MPQSESDKAALLKEKLILDYQNRGMVSAGRTTIPDLKRLLADYPNDLVVYSNKEACFYFNPSPLSQPRRKGEMQDSCPARFGRYMVFRFDDNGALHSSWISDIHKGLSESGTMVK